LTEAKPVVGAIVQARMGSTRLPGKVLLDLAGRPALLRLVERLRRCETLGTIIVATSVEKKDDAVAAVCMAHAIPVFRGSERDVLDRYYRAALTYGLSVVVRFTADCPLIDPSLADEMIRFFLGRRGDFDLVTNRHPLTYPDGLDLDVMAFDGLERAWRKADTPFEREHVVPFFWERGLRVHNFECPERLFSTHRWTLDYPEDYALLRCVYEALQHGDETFTTTQVLAFMAEHPEIRQLNAHRIAAT
jgi:spore coat polysaccharide biosynthesis protein SpsF